MPIDLSGKAYLLTGSASGIGLATAKDLLTHGANVGMSDINATVLSKAISDLSPEHRSRIFSQPVDVTSRVSVRSFLEAAKAQFGTIDGIASIAGTGGHNLGLHNVWETEEDEYDFIMNLNLRGTFYILVESLKEGYFETGRPISIVSVGSMFSTRGFKKGAVFAASKHAAAGLVKSAAMETADRGIRINAVLPYDLLETTFLTMAKSYSGAVDTPMHRANLVSGADHPVPNAPISRPGDPEEIAAVIRFLLSDESKFVTGASWSIDGGANA